MAVSEDVMGLVALLDAEDFSALAGEILTEIALGREIEDGGGEIRRISIPPEEQLREAVQLLRLRLTEPAKRLIEAQEIASSLNGGVPTSISFIDVGTDEQVKAVALAFGESSRDTKAITELEAGLQKLVAERNGIN